MVRRAERWQLAVAQHPMYLIIREDEGAAERIPPWGSPTIEAYIDRIRANLDALGSHPDLRLGFEWSGAELDLLAEDAPDVLARLRSMSTGGRLGFYNGTYAQPHLHVLSSEANFRQFEAGRRAYEDRLGLRVTTYAHQEASVHVQVPQLLRAFGFDVAVVPGFLSTITWLEGGVQVNHGVRGPRFLNGRELTTWRGLDGTTIPLLQHQPIPRDRSFRETLSHETVIGRLGVPRLLIDLPDMVDIDADWLAERADVETVILDQAIAERLAQAPPIGIVSLTTSWSSLEGIGAESLSRSIREAESAVLAADAVQAIAMVVCGRAPLSTDETWRTILRSQHHDTFSLGAPGLRARARDWLDGARRDATALADATAASVASRLSGTAPGDLVVFSPTPHPTRCVVEVDVPGPVADTAAGLIDADDGPVAAELEVTDDGASRLRFLADLPGLGYRTYRWAPAIRVPASPAPEAISGPFEFVNGFLRVRIGADGTFLSLRPSDGPDLLDPTGGTANRLSATDSGPLATADESDAARLARLAAPTPTRGPALRWQAVAPTTVQRGPLGVRLRAHGRLSERIRVDVEIDCLDALPRIEIRHRFEFDDASIGTYFDDDSKLLLHWPLRVIDGATHDVPFGVVDAVREQSIFPTTWLDLRVGDSGLLLLHAGTPRHWIEDDEVVRLLGWGEDTDAIGNRLGRSRWLKRFDQRLRGEHVIGSAVVVHPATWGPDDLIAEARSYAVRPVVHVIRQPGAGPLPLDSRLVTLPPTGPHATSVTGRSGRVVLRVHGGPNEGSIDDLSASGLRIGAVRSPGGDSLDRLAPWQIAELTFEEASRDVRGKPLRDR